MRLPSVVAAGLASLIAFTAPAKAQVEDGLVLSQCLAIANNLNGPGGLPVHYASYTPAPLGTGEVRIAFVGHSTYRIETQEGFVIATDFAGFAGPDVTPDVVTMNQAHSTHYTDYPDPAITHVLRGWNPDGGPARHALRLSEEVYIRNVTTDIRQFDGMTRIKDGNSIFIFEVAGLCIGHLGHLHHMLTDDHFAKIGRLDVVMVPVDGSYTMNQPAMITILERLKASVVLPMHYFGASRLAAFVSGMEEKFAIDIRQEPEMVISLNTLPRQPTVVVLRGY